MSRLGLIVKLLDRNEKTDAYADILLGSEFKKTNLDAKEKAFVQEVFFGVIRWRQRLDWIIGQFFKGNLAQSPRFVRYILQIGLYQLAYLDRVSDHHVVNESVALAKKKGGRHWGNKINAILRAYLRNRRDINYPDIETSPAEAIAVRYSHPQWMVERWINRWGIEDTIALCEANNLNPEITLRVNRTKVSPSELQSKLLKLDVDTVQSEENVAFLRAKKIPELNHFPSFQQGLFTIQDESAGLACQLLNSRPGERVADLCAAPGGKTTYLLELMQNLGTVISVDRNYSRLKLIRQNLKRLDLKQALLVEADGRQVDLKNIDKIIVDAPCSGLGVLSKRVDLRWKRSLKQINELTEIQYALLINALKMVKQGGIVIYSTCTIEPEENEQVIERCLEENRNVRIDPASEYVSEKFVNQNGFVLTLPHKHNMDGAFAARLIKE